MDTLAAAGSPIDDDEHIQVILDGLSDVYDQIVASILSRNDPYTIQEIEALLMAIEERIEKRKKPNAFGMPDLQANLVHTQSYRGGRGSGNRGGFFNSSRAGSVQEAIEAEVDPCIEVVVGTM